MGLLGNLLGVVVGFVVLAVLFSVLERFWPSVPRPRRLFCGRRTDLLYFVFTPTVGRLFSGVVVFVSIMSLAYLTVGPLTQDELRGIQGRDTLLGRQPGLVQLLEITILGDLLGYWSHRAFHNVSRLWKVHAVHHSSTDLDWLSSVRVHPLNDVANNVVIAAPLLLLGFSPAAFAAFIPLLTLYAIMLHANVSWSFGPLRKVIASPTYHRWHHAAEEAAVNKNFAGLYPAWDLLFGTFYMPEGVRPEKFGVIGGDVPEGFVGQLAYPFRRDQKAATGTVSAATSEA